MSYNNKESLPDIIYQLKKLRTLIFPFISSNGSPYEKGKSYVMFYGCYEMLSSFINQVESGRIYSSLDSRGIPRYTNMNQNIEYLKILKEKIKPMFSDEGSPYEQDKMHVNDFHMPINYLDNVLSAYRQRVLHQSKFSFTKDELIERGFEGFASIKQLMNDSSKLPDFSGVYILLNKDSITLDENNKPMYSSFIFPGTGGFFKDRDPNVEISTLQRKMHPDSKVMYIGKATNLKRRIKQYLSFGQGKNIGHYGGRYIWQLRYSSKLILAFKKVSGDVLPENYERELINLHKERFDRLPFANLR